MWRPRERRGAERTCGPQAKRSRSPLSTKRPASSQWTTWTEQDAPRGEVSILEEPARVFPLECAFGGDGHSFTSALKWGWHTVGTQISAEEVSAL